MIDDKTDALRTHETVRARAIDAIAETLCVCHFTDGFCGGREGDRPDCKCRRLARESFDALTSRGMIIRWPCRAKGPL